MKRIVITAVVVAVVLIAGCEKKEAKTQQGEMVLYCGAGIRPVADELIETFERQYGIRIIPDYAGSEVLLSKMKLVRKGDLYMPGDKHYVEQAAKEDMILSRRSVCYWFPTILVQKGNPKGIHSLKDLLKDGARLGLGDAGACAIGRTSKKILVKNNISFKDLEKNLVYQSLTVNELGMQIQAGALDAVIIWDAMAKYYSEHGDEVPIAVDENIVSTVDIGVLKFTKHKQSAEKFVDFVSSEEGQGIFEKHNYSTQPPR